MTIELANPPQTVPSDDATADALDRAADHLEKVGLNKNYLYDEDQADAGTPVELCRVDIIGAINVAVHGAPRWPVATSDTAMQLALRCYQAVRAHLGGALALDEWNDIPKRTRKQVVAALRATATALRGEVAS